MTALQETPTNAFVMRCLAATLGHLGDVRGMLQKTEKMVELEPWNKKSRFLLKVLEPSLLPLFMSVSKFISTNGHRKLGLTGRW